MVALVGLGVVVFPAPATSALGAGLVRYGLVWLAREWGRGHPEPDR